MVWIHISLTHTQMTLTQTDLIGLFLFQETETTGGGVVNSVSSCPPPCPHLSHSFESERNVLFQPFLILFPHKLSLSLPKLWPRRWERVRGCQGCNGRWVGGILQHSRASWVNSAWINTLSHPYSTLPLKIWEFEAARGIAGYQTVNIWSTACAHRSHFDAAWKRSCSLWIHRHLVSLDSVQQLSWNDLEAYLFSPHYLSSTLSMNLWYFVIKEEWMLSHFASFFLNSFIPYICMNLFIFSL